MYLYSPSLTTSLKKAVAPTLLIALFLGLPMILTAQEGAQTTPDALVGPLLSDGIYLVDQTYTSKPAQPKTEDKAIVPYDQRFNKADDQPKYVVVKSDDYISLDLLERPLKLKDSGGKQKLVLSLTEQRRNKLSVLTEENTGKILAIIVGGNVVNLHSIKEKLDQGRIQITGCTESTCEYLYTELQDNMVR